MIKDPNDPNSELITDRFASVLFGATSSPFLIQATLDTHLKKSNSPNKTEISNNLYVDNFQGTTSSESKLLNIYHKVNRELMGANMPLQSWVSNNAKLNQLIATEFPDYQVLERTKVLGVEWNMTTDQLTNKLVEPDTTNLRMRNYSHKSANPSTRKTYGTVAYLVSNGQANLLTSKARVAPLKKRSLPQLELTALLLGVRLAHYLIKALSNIHFEETVVWSDNEAVLQWVKNNNSKNPFVSNRVKEIRELSAGFYTIQDSCHIASQDVPVKKRHVALSLPIPSLTLEKWTNLVGELPTPTESEVANSDKYGSVYRIT
ncbi:uncharacterized protein [Procambarus clarkii]|uniref:uncharacterized protein n=1 Tax=Procambarus clarkii TaxID=6728 RepID=UPI0037427A4E